MPSACHSWDEYLSFSRLLTISLDLWLAACLFLFLSFCTFLAVSLCLAFPPTLHLSLSTWLHLSIKCLLISDGYFLMPVSLSLSLVSFALFFMSKMVCWSALLFAPWLSHCLAESHVFIWSLWEFAASEGFTPQITPDLHRKDDYLLLFEWVLDYFAHSLGYHTASVMPEED